MTDTPGGGGMFGESSEVIGAMLARIRAERRLTQHQVATMLKQVSSMPTVTRHEVSRWERGERIPSEYWLGWLAQVLEVPLPELRAARARSKEAAGFGDIAGRLPGAASVSLSYEYRATSVQVSAVYERPEHARSALGLFGRLAGFKADGDGGSPAPAASDGIRYRTERPG
jgi:transcriptional regulator with XRE-family HTH domain